MLLLAAVLFVFPVKVFAADCVYIAGNPDLNPFEYYNKERDRYEGVLPTLYQQMEEETGIEFRYVQSGQFAGRNPALQL